MKSIANQYRDLKEGRMSQQNFMRNLRMTMPQYVTNVTSFGDAIKILKNKSIIVEATLNEFGGEGDSPDNPKLQAAAKYLVQNRDKFIKDYFNQQGADLLSSKSDKELYNYIVNNMHSDGVYDTVADMKASTQNEAWDSPYDGGADDLAAMGKEENIKFHKAAIEAATGDKISHTEEDDYGEPIYWSTENPYVNYFIGGENNDQIIKYDGKTGERYPVGDLKDYNEPSDNDYEPDTDADYEEPREDFDMAEGEGNDPEKEWDEEEEDETDDREYDEDEMFNPAYMSEGEDEDAMYDAMIKKIEDELAAMEAAKAQYDEMLNEALNKDIKAFGQDLDKRFKEAGFDTLVLMQPATPQQLNIVATNPKAVLFEVSQTPETQMLILHVNPKVASKAESIINKFQFSNYTGPILKRGWTAKQVTGAINPGDIYKQDNDKAKGLWYFYRLAKVNTTVKTASTSAIQPNQTNLEEAKKPNVEKAEDENFEEVTLGIFMEHACFPDKSYEEIEKIVKKNIKKNPNYYTNYKLTGIRDYELETMDASKPETHQMKFYTEKDAVDTARGMQKVKMPKKEEKKKLKENKIRTDIKGQIVQATNNDGVTFSKNDEAKAIDNGEKIKITGFKEEQGKVKALFSKGMFASAIDIDGLEKVVSASPIAQALTKEEIEELMREVMNEYYDGRDNLIDPIAAEENN